MDRLRSRLGVFCGLLLLVAAGGVGADIRETKHNLSGAAAGESGLSPEQDRLRLEREVCVFCHTPSAESHASGAPVVPVPAPRWQQQGGGGAFSLFDDIGRGVEAGGLGESVGTVSMACLSCHDSTQAYGTGTSAHTDHPFGVPYRGGPVDKWEIDLIRRELRQGGLPFRFGWRVDEASEFRIANSAQVNNRQVWWVSTAGAQQRTKSDLPLYPRRTNEMDPESSVVPFIECTSCHDPHTTNSLFLRVRHETGRLCLACHAK